MRIVYCIPEISHPGGIGRVTTIKANWFAERGDEVYIVTSSQFDEPNYFDLSPKVNHIDLAIGFQAGMDNRHIIQKLIKRRKKMALYQDRLSTLIYEIKPDIVVSTFSNDSDFLYKLKDGSKKILEYHFSHDGYKSVLKYGNLPFMQKVVQILKVKKQEFIAKKYDAFIVLTKEDANSWTSVKNMHVIPNMVSFKPNAISNCENKRVIAVGRLDYQKKIDRLLYIWKLVSKDIKDWKLDIFGTGPNKEQLIQLIKDLGLENNTVIHNPTPNIFQEYLNSSVLCMTSTYEGLPMTMLEAMACGLPCVTYDYKCGPKDVIYNGVDGYIIAEGKAEEYVEKLNYLLNNCSERKTMGSHAAEKSTQFSIEKIMEKWESLFKTLITNRT